MTDSTFFQHYIAMAKAAEEKVEQVKQAQEGETKAQKVENETQNQQNGDVTGEKLDDATGEKLGDVTVDKLDEDKPTTVQETSDTSPIDSTYVFGVNVHRYINSSASFFTRWFRWSVAQVEKPWPPADEHEVVQYPADRYARNQRVFPTQLTGAITACFVHEEKMDDDEQSIYHVVFVGFDDHGVEMPLSLFRVKEIQSAIELCERCRECQDLFFCAGK